MTETRHYQHLNTLKQFLHACLWLLCLLPFTVSGQHSESGLPRLEYYPPHVYNGHNQVFQSVQGPDGIVYITNYGAILTWDGERWGRIPVPGAGFLYGISFLDENRLAVCGVNTIGLIEPGEEGRWTYHSLVTDLPVEEREGLGEIWDMANTPDGLFFFTRRSMIRWKDGETRVWHFNTEKMIYGFWSGSSIYVQCLDDGLYRLDGEEVTLISKDSLFQKPGPRMIIDQDQENLLVVTSQEGLWRFDGMHPEPIPGDASSFLSEAVVNRGVQLAGGRLALGTFKGGLAIVDKAGNFQRLVDENSGLPSNIVTSVSQDREGGLWVSLGSGIARVEVDGIITRYDRSVGLPNVVVTGILRHRGSIYISSANGLYQLRGVKPPQPPQWEQVPGTSSEVSAMVPHGNDLFATTKGQVIRYDGKQSEVVWDDFGLLRAMHILSNPTDHIMVGGRIGLGLIYHDGDAWNSAGPLPGLEDHVYSITEDSAGNVWLGTVFSGVIRIQSEGTGEDWIRNARVQRYGRKSGLSSMEHVQVKIRDGHVTALTPTGPQAYNTETDKFESGEAEVNLPPPEGWAWDVMIHDDSIGAWGSVYPLAGAEDDFSLYVGGRSPAGDWSWVSPGVFEDIGGLLYLYLENGEPSVLWAGGWSGLLRWEIESGLTELRSTDLNVVIREIRLPDGKAAYSGAGPLDSFSFPHSRSGLTFKYAAPLHTPGLRITYRTRLENFDTDWTDWGGDTERTFTNVPGGTYRFLVEARTPSGLTAQSETASFVVLPPWYQSSLAYIGYTALAVLLFVGAARLRMAALRRENRILEGMVDERTAELAINEKELRKAREVAEFANKQKSQFLANMSHELRTPLNAIMGYAQILERDPSLDDRNRKRIAILNTSCNLLVHLVNEVLDLSKIEAGRLEVQESAVHLERSVRALVESFGARASQHGLTLDIVSDPSIHEWVMIDILKVEQILGNLIGNAIKFTREGGVTVRIGQDANLICIDVEDTGVGIPEDEAESIFDAFYQTGDQPGKEAGTGLGLAISRRLSEVMGGDLACSSCMGKGTRFRLRLPLKPAGDQQVLPGRDIRRVTGYSGKRQTILVVDDVPANRDIVIELLSPLGFEVLPASTGQKALDLVTNGGVDAVLLDVRMAPMGGKEVLRRLRDLHGGENLPVISYSASLIGFTRADAIEMGCNDWLPKPFTPEDLFEKLGRLLNIELQYENAISAPTTGSAYQFSQADLEELRQLADRREPSALKNALEAVRSREPDSTVVVDSLLDLLSRFRLGEIGDQLENMKPREASS